MQFDGKHQFYFHSVLWFTFHFFLLCFLQFFLGVFVLAHWVRNMLTHSKQNKANCGA